jgi:hypothetical protein
LRINSSIPTGIWVTRTGYNFTYSDYNAFQQLTVEHRFCKGLSFVANYTFSKALDSESAGMQLTVTNPDSFVPNFNYGRSDLDVTHSFSSWAVYNLPLLPHVRRLVRDAFGGWQTTGIWTWIPVSQSMWPQGRTAPFRLSTSTAPTWPGIPTSPATGPHSCIASGSILRHSRGHPGTFGDSPRNLLH